VKNKDKFESVSMRGILSQFIITAFFIMTKTN